MEKNKVASDSIYLQGKPEAPISIAFFVLCPVCEVGCVLHSAYLLNLADTSIYVPWPQGAISCPVAGVLYPATQGRPN